MWDLILIALFLIVLYWYVHSSQYPPNFPPGPRHFLPFIGDPLFAIGQDTTAGFQAMHKKYGKIIGLNFLGRKVVSISDLDILQKIYSQDDFTDRPCQEGINYYRHGAVRDGSAPGIIFSNGHTWKDMRRFTLRTLRDFGFGKRSIAEIVQDEFTYLSKVLEQTKGNPVETTELFNVPVVNAIWRVLAGERLEAEDPRLARTIHAMDRLFADSGSVYGFLGFGSRKALLLFENLGLLQVGKGTNYIFDIVDEQIADHESSFEEDSLRDVTDCFIQQKIIHESDEEDRKYAKQNLRNIYMDLFLAGSETTSSTLKFALLYMVLYPDIQKSVQTEVDKVMKNNSAVANSDLRSKMPYTEAVLLEVQRIANIVPGSLLHTNSKPACIEGYTFPPGTSINSNMAAILMDPIAFPDPDQFKPERFIDQKGCFVPHPNVIPFGIGKRRCLGESLAKTELFIFFTGLIEKFDIRKENEDVKLITKYRPGITLSPYPFKIRFIARN